MSQFEVRPKPRTVVYSLTSLLLTTIAFFLILEMDDGEG